MAIACGGALGATARWSVVEATGTQVFPWPVLVVNVFGSLLLGVLLAEEPSHPRARVALHDLGAIGFCGGLTTFSTFALEVVDLVQQSRTVAAVAYAAASVASTVAAVVLGAALLRRVRALRLPLEEAP